MVGLGSQMWLTGVFMGLLAIPATGQESGIRLTIPDASGAVIPGAAISVM